MQKAFHFLKGPADVLSASTACRRWRGLACAGSVWWVKAEREGILDKAAAFEVEVPLVQEGGSLEDEETATMACQSDQRTSAELGRGYGVRLRDRHG